MFSLEMRYSTFTFFFPPSSSLSSPLPDALCVPLPLIMTAFRLLFSYLIVFIHLFLPLAPPAILSLRPSVYFHPFLWLFYAFIHLFNFIHLFILLNPMSFIRVMYRNMGESSPPGKEMTQRQLHPWSSPQHR